MTVTRAFRAEATISSQTRERVKAAAARLNFHPNPNARGLRGGSTMSVGILMSDPVGSLLGRKLSELLLQDHYVTYIADSLGDVRIAEAALRDFSARRVDGVFMQWRPQYENHSGLLDALRSIRNMAFFSDTPIPIADYDCCRQSYFPVYREIVAMLLAAGRRKIVYLGRPEHTTSIVCRTVLQENGFDFAGSLWETASYPGKPLFANYYDALKDRLTSEIPDVIFTNCDTAAAQICACLRDHGRKVPVDTAVIGCGNEPLSGFCAPPIATIECNYPEAAHAIHAMLMDRIRKPDTATRTKQIEARFIRRESAAL